MAKKSAHVALVELDFGDMREVVNADRTILRNKGFGWKVYGKVKPDYDPVVYAEKRKSLRHESVWAPWWDALKAAEGSLEAKHYIAQAIRMMPTDPDGVWSEIQDSIPHFARGTVPLSCEECVELCRTFRVCQKMAMEERAANASKPRVQEAEQGGLERVEP